MKPVFSHISQESRRLLAFCLICVSLWAMIAHGYAYLNYQPTHDSLDGLHVDYPNQDDIHKIELGRVYFPAYCHIFRTPFSIPYLSGINTILWISFASFLIISTLNINSALFKTLICGIMTVNITVTALTATYVHDLDANMFSMLMACLSFYLWRKDKKLYLPLSAATLSISLGIYQSYICVTVSLIIISLIKDLLENQPVSFITRRGIEGIAILLLGGFIYYCSLQVILRFIRVPLAEDRSNSLTSMSALSLNHLPELIKQLYLNFFSYFTQPKTFFLSNNSIVLINRFLIIMGISILPYTVIYSNRSLLQNSLLLLLILIFPLGANSIFIVSVGQVHDLMQYALIFTYLLIIVLINHMSCIPSLRSNFIKCSVRYLCCAMLSIYLWGGIQTSNTAYHSKTLLYQATYSRMTSVLHEMHQNGFYRDMPVFINGNLPIKRMQGLSKVSRITGMNLYDAITGDIKSFNSYFNYILGEPIMFCSTEQSKKIRNDPRFHEMSTYPMPGYIQMIDDVMVIRFH